jgi:hypothetical protein
MEERYKWLMKNIRVIATALKDVDEARARHEYEKRGLDELRQRCYRIARSLHTPARGAKAVDRIPEAISNRWIREVLRANNRPYGRLINSITAGP